MNGDFFAATVKDDTHRVDGALVPDGGLKLLIPGLYGPSREGWPEHVVGWIRPLLPRVYGIPKVDDSVLVLRFSTGELRWLPWDPSDGLPSWAAEDYPNRSGMESRDGAFQWAFDKDGLHLGAAGAVDPLALFPGLKAWLNDKLRDLVLTHTHLVSVDPGTHSGTASATTDTCDALTDEGQATKVKGV